MAWGTESEVGMEAPSNLTASCSWTALGRDGAAAVFRLSPLALRRIDFALLGVEPAANRFDGVVFGQQAWERLAAGGQPADQA